MIAAGVHALGAALALGGVDEDAELAAAEALFLAHLPVFVGFGPLLAHLLALGFVFDAGKLVFERFGLDDLGQDGRVGALRHAVHAADALVGKELGYLGRDVAEIAQRAGSGGNHAARNLHIGFEADFGRAVVVGADNPLVEVGDIDDVPAEIVDQRLVGRSVDMRTHWMILIAPSIWSWASVASIVRRGISMTSE